MHVLYVLSGKNGITSFTYKELELLEENGIHFTLLFTKFNKINNIPKKEWVYYGITKPDIALFLLLNLIPFFFNKNFYKSLLNAEFKYFLLAKYYVNKLGAVKNEVSNIHVQMGDHKLILGYYLNKIIKNSKLSTTIHAHELYTEYRYENSLRYTEILNRCNQIFTISEFNREILINDLKVNHHIVKRMYLYPSFENQNLKNRKKILITGNWEYKKGYLDVLEALLMIDRDDYVVLIAGRSVNPEVDLDLPSLIIEKGLGKQVKLLGHINKTVLEFMYSYCDIFMLPSKTEYYDDGNPKEREGIPVALMEAIQFGMPIITTKHAGIPELVNNYIIREGDILQMKQAIVYFLDNIEKVQLESSKNAINLQTKFSHKNIHSLVEYFSN